MLLPIPNRPWSHLAIDFITDPPLSDTFTCILVTIYRFSIACKLIPLPRLPTSLETAEALFTHVLRLWDPRKPVYLQVYLLGLILALAGDSKPYLRESPQANGQAERRSKMWGGT